jgi:hypothetical protein
MMASKLWLLCFMAASLALDAQGAEQGACARAKSAQPLTVQCPANCTEALQAALYSGASYIRVLPPKGGGPATIGSSKISTHLVANGTNQVVEFAAGLELHGFLNDTFYPSTGSTKARGYNPALVTLTIAASNLTICGNGAVFRRISSSVSGSEVHMEGLNIINPGWDGLYARGIVGLTLKNCAFDRPYRNGISVIDAVDMLAENCTFSNSLPNGTGRVSPMAGVDLEPNRATDRLHNITFRKCTALNNSGAGFQVFPGKLNASSLPVQISFEDCHAEGVGFKPYGTVVSCGYYFNSFGGSGAPGYVKVTGGAVTRTASFGAAVYVHGTNDPHITFKDVLFDHVATQPSTFEQKLNFTNGPLAIAALGNELAGHNLGGITFDNVVVKDDRARPFLTVVGTSGGGVARVDGSITVHNSKQKAGCAIAAGAEGWTDSQSTATRAALCSNISITCLPKREPHGPSGPSAAALAEPHGPSGPSAAALALRERLLNAVASREPHFRIPQGTFLFSNTTLQITGAANMVIEAEPGTEFIFYFGFGVQLTDCRNLTFIGNGLTIDASPANYAQGTVLEIAGSAVLVNFDVDFLMPDTTAGPFDKPGGLIGAKVCFWNASTRLMNNFGNQFMSNSTPVTQLGSTHWRVQLRSPARAVAVGDLVTIFPRRGFSWNLLNSSLIVTQDVVIHAGGNMGFHESLGDGANVYRRVRIGRREGGKGLLALNADGFHSSDVGKGPLLEDSEISFTGDDFLNIHNRMLVICTIPTPGELVLIDVSGGALRHLQTGDKLRFYRLLNQSDMQKKLPNKPYALCPGAGAGTAGAGAECNVASVAAVNRTEEAALAQFCSAKPVIDAMEAPPHNAHLVIKGFPATLYRVKLQLQAGSAHEPEVLHPRLHGQPPLAYDLNLANFERRSSAGAIVRNNHFHDGFSRMGLLKAIGLTYEGNVVERAHGLHVYNEQVWLEGDLGLRDVALANNTIVYGSEPDQHMHVDVAPGLQNITCRDTHFRLGNGTAASLAHGC